MSKQDTIQSQARSQEPGVKPCAVLEMINVPTGLIMYAVQQWEVNGAYAKTSEAAKRTNKFIKGIAVWLILKNENRTGKYQNYLLQLEKLACLCKMTERTLLKYLTWLVAEGLLQVEGDHLVMSGYKALKKYSIDIRECQPTFLYDTTDNRTLAEIIIAIGMNLMKRRPARMYWKKVQQNPDAFSELRSHLVAWEADESKLDDPEYFRQRHLDLLLKSYREEGPGQSSFYLVHSYIKANPDLNFKGATYGRKMGYSVTEKINPVNKKDESMCTGFSHLKRRIAGKGLITVTKEHVESDYRARKDEKVFHHRYVESKPGAGKSGAGSREPGVNIPPKKKFTIWFRTDQITINPSGLYTPKIAA